MASGCPLDAALKDALGCFLQDEQDDPFLPLTPNLQQVSLLTPVNRWIQGRIMGPRAGGAATAVLWRRPHRTPVLAGLPHWTHHLYGACTTSSDISLLGRPSSSCGNSVQ